VRREQEDGCLLQLKTVMSWAVLDFAPLAAPVSMMNRVEQHRHDSSESRSGAGL
jgi:hypothetical protein